MKGEIRFEKGSGNIFNDLGLDNPDERLAKAKTASMIYDIIEHHKLTRKTAGRILGLPLTEMSDLLSGRFDAFSMEQMRSFLDRLKQDSDMVVLPEKQNEERLSLFS